MITVIPNVLSVEQVDVLMQDINPKENATDMNYFVSVDDKYGVRKIKCTEHTVIQQVCQSVSYKTESVSIVYYPTGSFNAPHADNCVIDNGVATRVKDWTHTGIIFLNNNFTGGELVYPNQGCVFIPTVGTMVIAPAGEDYIHYVNKITTGERFTLVFRFL